MEGKIKILVVDDNQLQLAIAGDALAEAGFEVFTVDQGPKVYSEVLKNNPHLILLDIMMPGIDGIEICRNLKRSPKTKDILIVIYSSKRDADLMNLCYEFGADGYIIKSEHLEQTVNRVKEILREKLPRKA